MQKRRVGRSFLHPFSYIKSFALVPFFSVCKCVIAMNSVFSVVFFFSPPVIDFNVSDLLFFHLQTRIKSSVQRRQKDGTKFVHNVQESKKVTPPFLFLLPPPFSEYACVQRGMSGPLRLSPGS